MGRKKRPPIKPKPTKGAEIGLEIFSATADVLREKIAGYLEQTNDGKAGDGSPDFDPVTNIAAFLSCVEKEGHLRTQIDPALVGSSDHWSKDLSERLFPHSKEKVAQQIYRETYDTLENSLTDNERRAFGQWLVNWIGHLQRVKNAKDCARKETRRPTLVRSSIVPRLAEAANKAINNVLRTGAVSVGQASPTGEVGFVAAFVLGAVPSIAAAWKTVLDPHGLAVRMTGIFCHQSPQVVFKDSSGSRRKCELADLLVVVDDCTSGTSATRFAALIQAKMAGSGGMATLTTPGDLTQLYLLSNWPLFLASCELYQ